MYTTEKIGLKSFINLILFTFILTIYFSFPIATYADTCSTISREQIIAYAKTGVGSPYIWGGDKWDPANRKWGGADCSGYVLKAWQVPRAYAYKQSAGHPYTTFSFKYRSYHWYPINLSELQKGDILVKDDGHGNGHVVIFSHKYKNGSYVVYEAKGKAYGIVYGAKYISSDYVARRRHNLANVYPNFFVSKRLSNKSLTQAVPYYFATPTTYFDYFSSDDLLNVRNASNTVANISSYINSNPNVTLALNPFQNQAYQGLSFGTGYLSLSSQNPLLASKQNPDTTVQMSQPSFFVSTCSYIAYFRPPYDSIYVNNMSSAKNTVTLSLINDGKVIRKFRRVINPKGRWRFNLSKTKWAKKIRNCYVKSQSSRQGILMTKRMPNTKTVSAVPHKHVRNKNSFNYVEPLTDTYYLSNLSSKTNRFTVYIYNAGKLAYLKKSKVIARDLIKLNLAKTKISQGFMVITSNYPLLLERLTVTGAFYSGVSSRYLNYKYYLDLFNPQADSIVIANPNQGTFSLDTNVYANGALVLTDTRRIPASNIAVFSLKNTTAVNYSNTFLQFSAKFQ
ncbi:MAG: peptidoglycan endopeptidase [Actinobacteria bacterium]|nr:MAG: peptidoglycan endopeptidase [Actinomycetota bacterium]